MVLKQIFQRAAHRKLQAAAIELCDAGLITCTRGKPGDDGATYALAGLPLDNPDQFNAEVRAMHAANTAKLNKRGDS